MVDIASAWEEDYQKFQENVRQKRISATSHALAEFMGSFGAGILKLLYNRHAKQEGYPVMPPSLPGHPNIIDRKFEELLKFLAQKFEDETDQAGGRIINDLNEKLRNVKRELFG